MVVLPQLPSLALNEGEDVGGVLKLKLYDVAGAAPVEDTPCFAYLSYLLNDICISGSCEFGVY